MDGRPRRLRELAGLFLKLGTVAFGGPAAHIAMFEDEVVHRRKWMDRQHFLDLIGATNLIPGPNSTEMTMHVGFERAGWQGLVVAGSCFVLPAVLITVVFAWLYSTWGTLPVADPLLFGIKPAVIAVILGAVWRLGKPAIKGWESVVLGAVVVVALLAGLGEVPVMLAGGVVGMLVFRAMRRRGNGADAGLVLLAPSSALFGPGSPVTMPGSSVTGAAEVVGGVGVGAATLANLPALGPLFLFFLKVGAVLYGSGYVLVAFLEGGLVEELGWLTMPQLMDAIAIGQLTPGPVLSTATFLGYVILGLPGAGVATIGIFLPSFLFVWLLNPLIPKMRSSVWMGAFLDAVNVAALALMATVTVELGLDVLTSWPAWLIMAAATGLTLVWKVNAAWLVLGGALLGPLLYPLS